MSAFKNLPARCAILFIAATTLASAASTGASSRLTAVWANEGSDKVWQEETRASSGQNVANAVWDGKQISISGAKNEVISFVLLLESTGGASNVSVDFSDLAGPGGAHIATTTTASGDQLWQYVNRNIEGFYLRYLKITGINRTNFGYEAYYDERHVPSRLRRPLAAPDSRVGVGTWADRPMADKSVPDIAVPLELQSSFNISAGNNQGIWYDVYVPRDAAAGVYTGTVTVKEAGTATQTIPVSLRVRSFALPDQPASKTMVYASLSEILGRYAGTTYAGNTDARTALSLKVLNNQFRLFKRHKISMVDENCDSSDTCPLTQPASHWVDKLSGSFYSRANGYDGPGQSTPDNIFVVGPYGSWHNAKVTDRATMQAYMDSWEGWFQTNSPTTDRFLYVIDETSDFTLLNTYLDWMKTGNTTIGKSLRAMATVPLSAAVTNAPRLDIVASSFGVADTTTWANAYKQFTATAGKSYWHYNGTRPASGSFLLEDDGVSMRMKPWTAYKLGAARWFYWDSTYYMDFQAGGNRQNDVFNSAVTYGADGADAPVDNTYGHVGYNRNNGDGVLVYPGTDARYPASSYNVAGPFASVRLKNWRRGVQDVDYIAMAMRVDAAQTQSIVQSIVPKVLWEVGVEEQSDPTYRYTDISWPTDATAWENARTRLAAIIEGAKIPSAPVIVGVD